MSNIGKIVAVLVVIFLGLAGYQYLKSDKVPVDTGIMEENFGGSDSGENQEFLRVLKNLEVVTLDGSVLTSPAFNSLFDFSIELRPQPQGRPNPFRPVNPFDPELLIAQVPVRATSTTPAAGTTTPAR